MNLLGEVIGFFIGLFLLLLAINLGFGLLAGAAIFVQEHGEVFGGLLGLAVLLVICRAVVRRVPRLIQDLRGFF